MMKIRKKIKTLIIILLLIPFVYFGIYLVQNYTLRSSFAKEKEAKFDEDTKFVRCNYNIWTPEFSFAFGTGDGGLMGFYRLKKMFYQTEEGWDDADIGGTTIKNATFPTILKMAKEDCSQFQQPKGDSKDETINWVWSPVRIQTTEEVATDVEEKKREALREMMYEYYKYSDELKQEFNKIYGDPFEMSRDEQIEIALKIEKEGYDEEFYQKRLKAGFPDVQT